MVSEYERIIPIVKYKKGDKDVDEFGQEECVICMEQFKNGEKVRKIPTCRHLFHEKCIVQWLAGE